MNTLLIILIGLLILLAIFLCVGISKTRKELAQKNRYLDYYKEFAYRGAEYFGFANNSEVRKLAVYACRNNIRFIIRYYGYYDADSFDYAVRCAEELLEKLNEEI